MTNVITSYKHKLQKIFAYKWLLQIAYGIALTIYLLAITLRYDVLIRIFTFFVAGVTFVLLPIWLVMQVVNKHIGKNCDESWYWIIAKIVAQLLFSGAFCIYFMLIFSINPPDFYGAHKSIPKDISIKNPVGYYKQGYGFSAEEIEKIVDGQGGFDVNKQDINGLDVHELKKTLAEKGFVVLKGFQGGIYYYLTDYQPNNLQMGNVQDTGYIYLKVYEINSNDRLSKASIDYDSRIEIKQSEDVSNSNSSIDTDNTNKLRFARFTIHEGSWGDYYGVRIEMWYQPTDNQGQKTKAEYKISEDNYIVEGWMR